MATDSKSLKFTLPISCVYLEFDELNIMNKLPLSSRNYGRWDCLHVAANLLTSSSCDGSMLSTGVLRISEEWA